MQIFSPDGSLEYVSQIFFICCAWLPGTQEILLYEAMTVKETLTTAASFFTSDSIDIEQRVTEVLSMLGLQEQANTKVGGLFYRGCSGGQKRRITVGLFQASHDRKKSHDVNVSA